VVASKMSPNHNYWRWRQVGIDDIIDVHNHWDHGPMTEFLKWIINASRLWLSEFDKSKPPRLERFP
jgi:hypothetical protein